MAKVSVFKEKEISLNKAIERVDKMLTKYRELSEKLTLLCVIEKRYRTPSEMAQTVDYDKCHDLKDRLFSRLQDNYDLYQCDFFEVNGWVAY